MQQEPFPFREACFLGGKCVPNFLDSRKRRYSKIVAPACHGAFIDKRQFKCAREVSFGRVWFGRSNKSWDFTGYRFLIIGHRKTSSFQTLCYNAVGWHRVSAPRALNFKKNFIVWLIWGRLYRLPNNGQILLPRTKQISLKTPANGESANRRMSGNDPQQQMVF